MSDLQGAAKGYLYQDCVSALIVCHSLFLDENIVFTADKKDENSIDFVDDLKILYGHEKRCFQIKYSKEHVLSLSDFGETGQLNLQKLLAYDANEETSGSLYLFFLHWKFPADDLINYLSQDSDDFFLINNGKNYRFSPDKTATLQTALGIKESKDGDFNRLINKIHFLIEAPESSGEWNRPESLERQLEEQALQLGAEQYPNANISKIGFCNAVCRFINVVRTKDDHSFRKEEFLRASGLQKDPGLAIKEFEIDPNIYVSQNDQISKIVASVQTNKMTFLFGEPGSGKSYLTQELFNEFDHLGIKNSHHYLYVNSDQNNPFQQFDPDALVAHVLQQTREKFPNVHDERLHTCAETIDILKVYASHIKETYVIVIDGLDHAYREYIHNETVDKLETVLAEITQLENVHVLLVSQPLNLLGKWPKAKTLQVESWDIDKIKALASRYRLGLSERDAVKILAKSRGNPLYISYLLKTSPEDIDSCPEYSGNIEVYYQYLVKKETNFRLFQYLALIPFYFSTGDLRDIANQGEQTDEFMTRNQPLLRFNARNNGYLIYHESFKRFLLERCKGKGVDPKPRLNDIIHFLEAQDFYQDERSYWHLCDLYCQAKRYEDCLVYANYDFLYQSVYYGWDVLAVKNNLYFFKEAAAKLQSFRQLNACFLLSETLEIQYGSSLFCGTESAYQSLFIKLFTIDQFKKLFYRHRVLSDRERNETAYTVLSAGYEVEDSIPSEGVSYSSFEPDLYQKINLIIALRNGPKMITLSENVPLTGVVDIYDVLISQNALERLNISKNKNAQLYLNSLDLVNRVPFETLQANYWASPESNSKDHIPLILNFITYIQYHLDDPDIAQSLQRNSSDSFYYSLLYLILKNKKALTSYKKTKKREKFETTLVANIQAFNERTCSPGRGRPRACDFIERDFKAIFHQQLLLPLAYLKQKKNITAYFLSVLETCSNLSTVALAVHVGCICLEEILEIIPRFLNETNYLPILQTLENYIQKQAKCHSYYYDAEYCFLFGNLYYPYSPEKAEKYYSRGVAFLLGYGDDRDTFMGDVLSVQKSALKAKIKISRKQETVLGDDCVALLDHTNGKETSDYGRDWLNTIAEQNPKSMLNLIINYQLTQGIYFGNKDAFYTFLNSSYTQIDYQTLYHAISCYPPKEIPASPELQLYLVKALITHRKKEIAYEVLLNLLEEPEKYESDQHIIDQINTIIAQHFKGRNRIEKAKIPVDDHPTYCREIQSELAKTEFLNCRSLLASTPASIIAVLKTLSYSEKERRHLLLLFSDILTQPKIASWISDVGTEDVGEDNYVFLNATAFAMATDDWSKRFVCPALFQKAYRLNSKLCLRYFFQALANLDGSRGFGNISAALSPFPEFKNDLKLIFDDTANFVDKRCPEKIGYYPQKPFLEHANLSLLVQLVCLSSLSDYESTDNGNDYPLAIFLRFARSRKNEYHNEITKFLEQNKTSLRFLEDLEGQ